MADAAERPGWTYWSAAIMLIAFGTLTGFSIGIPFLVIGLALVVMAPFEQRARFFVPVLVALVGFFIGFVVVAPLGCTVSSTVIERDGKRTTQTSSGSTSCSNVLGLEYSGDGDYNPPLAPGLISGLALAAALGAATLVLQRGRSPEKMKAPTLGWTGVALNATWSLFLTGIGLFNDWALDPQWQTALVFVGLTATPAVIAVFGVRGRPALLLTAGVMCVPLSFISLAGATLPLLLPAALYLIAYARS